MRETWDQFYELTRERPPSEGIIRAVSLLGQTGDALDLGCGAGRDTRYLLSQGFEVTAVDRETTALAELSSFSNEHLHLVQSAFEDFTFATYNLINAHFALPFMAREQFSAVFTRLKASLKPGGIFVGQFFGIHDEWNTHENNFTFFTREQALSELDGLQIIEFEEIDADGRIASGTPKHWHVYHIIAAKERRLIDSKSTN
ncbi:class I SAM-dependent methyltransferase [Tengunoibacter tsumagoiensis]|uniref:Tellurite resistance protein n=1 Tax=Tengunoibacter tsumagoiensis TaxID=2014871 RepID=A0A401ZZV6_9CHLR|nr:class I SAM-dependent methyltransferase [Tengunoibacter tsumagoiensis]GCE12420.1 tellurite resistance protein [Tengunoibacter tsumagoiensis]